MFANGMSLNRIQENLVLVANIINADNTAVVFNGGDFMRYGSDFVSYQFWCAIQVSGGAIPAEMLTSDFLTFFGS